MKLKVYIETSIVSYLTAHLSRDLIIAAHQQITLDWWENRRSDFELFISQAVVQESSVGDSDMAQKRLAVLSTIPLLELKEDAIYLAQELVNNGPLPKKASIDALHISMASVHGMDYLLTWNCKHIANAAMRNAVVAICRSNGFEPPVICTPEELMGG
jgi:hypothetical protein